MAVYERNYRRYTGNLTAEFDRIMVFPRYAYEQILRSKLFLAFMTLCLVWSFVLACLLYIPHNLGFIKAFQLDPEVVSRTFANFFNAKFFFNWFMLPVGFMAMILTFVVGVALIDSEHAQRNATPLIYSVAEAVLGVVVVALTRQVGLLNARIAPVGALVQAQGPR